MNSKVVRNALASLDNTSYNTRQDLEDAVYPFFGQLTGMFQGQSHRDLVDRLLAAHWVDFIKGKYTFFLPALEKFQTAETGTNLDSTIPGVTPTTFLTMQEIQALSAIGTPLVTTINVSVLESLALTGLIEYRLTEKGETVLAKINSTRIQI